MNLTSFLANKFFVCLLKFDPSKENESSLALTSQKLSLTFPIIYSFLRLELLAQILLEKTTIYAPPDLAHNRGALLFAKKVNFQLDDN